VFCGIIQTTSIIVYLSTRKLFIEIFRTLSHAVD
jgi:hypothetical protein